MGLTDRAWGLVGRRGVTARDLALAWETFQTYFTFMGNQYGAGGPLRTTMQGNREKVGSGFTGYASIYAGNTPAFACMSLRMRVGSEARFQFRQRRSGRPGDLFGTDELAVLETPWANATTGDLLTRMILSADLAGSAFVWRNVRGRRLQVLRPDWVSIFGGVRGNAESTDGWSMNADVLAYLYQPGGPGSGNDPVALQPSEVAMYAPIPDPMSPWRGMSPLQPVIRDVMGDNAATAHKLAFFENAATPNMVVKADPSLVPAQFREWVTEFKEMHRGLRDAYETLFLGGGADATVVGANLRQLDFKMTQGAGETRIAAALGTPPVLVGLSEGLQAATYSNFSQARRAFADETMRPMWRNIAGSLASIIDVPPNAELWYDDRDVPFLAEDVKEAAEIQQIHAASIRQLIDGGFEPDSVVDSVVAGDLKRLKHTGKLSVQLQEPGTELNGGSPNGKAPELAPVSEGATDAN